MDFERENYHGLRPPRQFQQIDKPTRRPRPEWFIWKGRMPFAPPSGFEELDCNFGPRKFRPKTRTF
ncbi:unnamed protein product [Dibothriocephalus latus]|uniref:Uncharacterized protein n=1 Tax=Dibothriocephalus latus TaxID=60516 RepID=A0A3P7M152_DIBLA|nr:unnamed protein product [Dibothriocephalus latus]